MLLENSSYSSFLRKEYPFPSLSCRTFPHQSAGIIVGCVGIVFALITVFVWRKMEHKQPIKISGKAVLTAVVGIVGALALGVGMCFTMVWGNMILGIVVGLVGIMILLCLIPLCKGLK